MKIFYILGACMLLTAIVLTVGAAYMFCHAIVRKKAPTLGERVKKIDERYKNDEKKKDWGCYIQKGIDGLLSMPLEDVYIKSFDGLKLHGYLLEKTGSKKTVIFVHGWRSSGLFDFSCIWEYYRNRGFNVLIIDHRAHGESEGKYICFGTKERFDVVDWCKWACDRFGTDSKIFLSGISMGSSTVMMALGTDGIPQNVVGASLDCGYTSAVDIFKHVLKKDFHLPSFPLLHLAEYISKRVADFDFHAFSSADGLKKATVPVVFIHGSTDDFVPVEHSYENIKSCTSPYISVIVEGAEHGMSYFTDKETVTSALDDLLDKLFEK